MQLPFPEIHFSQNWNGGKLNLKAFTTIRLWHPKKYQVGQLYHIYHKKAWCFNARCLQINVFQLPTLSEFVARLDTGMSSADCKTMLAKMYKNKVEDVNTADFALLLLLHEESPNWRQPTLEEMLENV